MKKTTREWVRKAEHIDPKPAGTWAVWRIDDNGNSFVVREHLSKLEAEKIVDEFTARGHKQTYWIELETREAKA